ncbi:MAG: divalent-cation tolerance protein CutA [Pyrinomonadaceae bacterium]
MIIVMTTVPTSFDANRLATLIVAEKLAACVQTLPPTMSTYFWEGVIRSESEILLLIKSLPEKFTEIEGFLKANHPYDVPEIVAIKAETCSADYLKWVTDYVG